MVETNELFAAVTEIHSILEDGGKFKIELVSVETDTAEPLVRREQLPYDARILDRK